MKKLMVLLMLVVLATTAFAGTGWFNDYILIDVNGNGIAAPTGYYWIGDDPSYGTQYDGNNLGTVTSLVIDGCDMKYWSDTQDRDNGAFYYSIDGGGYTEVIWAQSFLGGNDYQGVLSGLEIDVLSGLGDGSHTLTIYAKSWDTGGGQGDIYLNKGGANFTLSFTVSGATPITLASFTAKAKNGVVNLAWETASELENSHFLVYRDDVVIAQVEGAGTTTETNTYAYVDDEVLPGVHEYVLADVTYNGKEVKHDAVTVELGLALTESSFILNKAYPNPFNPSVTLSLEYAEGTNSEINIYNTQGVLVETLFSGYMGAGSHELNWNASNMQSGVYIVKMIAGNVTRSQKIVLMK